MLAQQSNPLTISTILMLEKGYRVQAGLGLVCLWEHRESRLIPLLTPPTGSATPSPVLGSFSIPISLSQPEEFWSIDWRLLGDEVQ